MWAKFFKLSGGRIFALVVYPFFVLAMYQDLAPKTFNEHAGFIGGAVAGAVFGWVMIVTVLDPFSAVIDRLFDKALNPPKKEME